MELIWLRQDQWLGHVNEEHQETRIEVSHEDGVSGKKLCGNKCLRLLLRACVEVWDGDRRPSIYKPWIISVRGGARSGGGTRKP